MSHFRLDYLNQSTYEEIFYKGFLFVQYVKNVSTKEIKNKNKKMRKNILHRRFSLQGIMENWVSPKAMGRKERKYEKCYTHPIKL